MNNLNILSEDVSYKGGGSFDEVYQEYITQIYKYVYVRVRHKEEAEDIAHTIFVKAFEAKRAKKIDITLNYLFVIARTTVIDYWRKKKSVNLDEPEIAFENLEGNDQGVHEELEKADIKNVVKCAIEKLNDDQKDVIIMKFINDMTTREVSKVMNKTQDNIRKIQSRAIEVLRSDANFNNIMS